jgi:protein-S-isoprenylcysteine O-methyltransferase Ste14
LSQSQVAAMVSDRDAADVRLFPPAVPILAILAGVALKRVWPIDVGVSVPAAWRYGLGGVIVTAAFLGLGFCLLIFRRGGQSVIPWKPTVQIVDWGPFRLSRNPMYLLLILICIGFAVLLANWWILALTPLAVWALQRFAIIPEEAYLEQKFGDDYLDYKQRVRRWI